MRNAPIVEDIRRELEAYAAKLNFDLEAFSQDIKRQVQECGHEFVSLPLKHRTVEAEVKPPQTAQTS